MTLLVLWLRSGYFSTELFERNQRSERALLLTMIEMFINGLLTPKAKVIVKEPCGDGVLPVDSFGDVVVRKWNEWNLA